MAEPLYDNELELVYDMYVDEKKTIAEIALELDRSTSFVRKCLLDQGVVLGHSRIDTYSRFTEEQRQEIVKQYNEGVYVSDIRRAFGLSKGGFYALLEKMDVELRTGNIYDKEQAKVRALALKMYREDWVLWFISQETGLSVASICQLARKDPDTQMRGYGSRGRRPKVVNGKLDLASQPPDPIMEIEDSSLTEQKTRSISSDDLDNQV